MANINRPSVVTQLLEGIDGQGYNRISTSSSDSLSATSTIHATSVPAPLQVVPDLSLSLQRTGFPFSGTDAVPAPARPSTPELSLGRPPALSLGSSGVTDPARVGLAAATLSAFNRPALPVRFSDLSGGGSHGEGEHPLDDDCHLKEATVVDGTDQTSTAALMNLGWTFQLHSSPTSSKVIYLDFDGHTTTGTSWNYSMGASFYSPAFDLDGNPGSFNNEELSRIQQIWQRVAADYAPFDVNVTTQAPPTDWLIKSGSTDANYGIRAVVTSFGPSSKTAGGIAVVNSFNASTDTPCFIYNKSLTGAAEAISHEVGHTLGLSHDGTSSSGYYYGHGSGETSWAPIMGVGYNKNVTQWDNGTYSGSNNRTSTANYGRGPNDMTVISTYNGFGYQLDQVGNTLSSAAPLTISGGSVSQFGRIETAADADCYAFLLQSTGDVNLKFDPYVYRAFVDRDGAWGGSSLAYTAPVSDGNGSTPYADSGTNLDLSVSLYNSLGGLLGSFDGVGLATTVAWSNLAAGSYTLRVDGVGTGSPTTSAPSGYSDYGSVGNYLISGTITNAADSTALITAAAPRSTSTSTTTKTTPTALSPVGRILQALAPVDTAAAAQELAPSDPLTGVSAGVAQNPLQQGDALLAPLVGFAPSLPDLRASLAASLAGLSEGPIVPGGLLAPLGAGPAPDASGALADLLRSGSSLAGSNPLAALERSVWAAA